MMDSKAFQALLGYKSALAQARIMLSQGLITAEELGIIETKMREIFGINFDSLENRLIDCPYDALLFLQSLCFAV